MLTKDDLDRMMKDEEKRLGVGSPEFLQRHNEIMQMIEKARHFEEKVHGTCTAE